MPVYQVNQITNQTINLMNHDNLMLTNDHTTTNLSPETTKSHMSVTGQDTLALKLSNLVSVLKCFHNLYVIRLKCYPLP